MASQARIAANNVFRERLVAAMDAEGMSKAELAAAIGAARQSVSNWVSGSYEPNLSQLRKLAEALRVSASYLVGETEGGISKQEAALSDVALKIGSLRLGRAARSVSASCPDLLDLFAEAERLVDERSARRSRR